MNLPDDRRYAPTHEWVLQQDDGDWLVGITDHAQDQLGDLVFVGEVKVGSRLRAGDVAAVVESVKTASDLYAPAAGEVVAFNDELDASPEKINESPYDTWIFRFRPDDASGLLTLLDAQGYRQQVDAG